MIQPQTMETRFSQGPEAGRWRSRKSVCLVLQLRFLPESQVVKGAEKLSGNCLIKPQIPCMWAFLMFRSALWNLTCVCVCSVFHGRHVEIREQPQMLVLTFHLVCDRISLLFSVCFRLVGPWVSEDSSSPLPISLWEDCGLQTHIPPALLLCRFWVFEVRSLYVCDKQIYL